MASLVLIYTAFKDTNLGYSLLFIFLGIASIAAAIKYTVGKSAYGYHGMGDVFVFLFFGLLSVMGSYFLYTKQLFLPLWLPACAIGFLSSGVLNLNNMRDRESDKKVGKNTLVVYLGAQKAEKYHTFLLLAAMLFMVVYTVTTPLKLSHWIYIVVFAQIIKHLRFVKENKEPINLDPQLKVLALSTFFLSVLFSLGLLIW